MSVHFLKCRNINAGVHKLARWLCGGILVKCHEQEWVCRAEAAPVADLRAVSGHPTVGQRWSYKRSLQLNLPQFEL